MTMNPKGRCRFGVKSLYGNSALPRDMEASWPSSCARRRATGEPIGKEMTHQDFNHLERTAKKLIDDGNVVDAIKIYLFLSDGDPSLDAGYLGERLGICYEQLGDLHAAKYWYGRAVDENPEVRLEAAQAYERLSNVGIDHLV